MEDTLRANGLSHYEETVNVLILVLMEDTLRDKVMNAMNNFSGLNPCFNGRYSQRDAAFNEFKKLVVLILVLMEDTLRGATKFIL